MTNDELQFLPAALEIQETPPLSISRYILWAIMLFFTIAIAWANVGEIDIVGIAQGKVVPSGQVKIIQPLETGVVRHIHVTEGEHVIRGQALIELDTTQTGADRDQIKSQQQSLELDRARLLTILEISADKKPVTNKYFSNLVDATPIQIQLQKSRASSQLNEFHARQAAIQDEKTQLTAEHKALAQRVEQLDATLPLITERVGSLKNLLDKKLAPRVQYLELEQERIEQVKAREIQRHNQDSITATIASLDQQLNAQQAEFESTLFNELSEIENRITAFEQELIKADQRIALQRLAAPVTGSVHQLTVHTIGGVVTPAQTLMHIVPDTGALEIEAWVPNKDIGFIHQDQEAEIKVETFPFTRYGTLDGKVINVSNDATPDERLGLVYATRVKMDKTTMNVEGKMVNLSPGMAVTVEVKMGKRRLIEFLLSPLLRYRDESVRER